MTQDLFDLNLTQLDAIYKTLKQQEKAADEESLLEKKSSADEQRKMLEDADAE